ncbi:hypothetical protein DFH94DRAFT_738552 [Russula ochroleuca]|uniref:Uncharacterized protein n=1 Tax=Russula ochroleuca TaxID=152965 RepID=A0A9P5MXJ4_9AGAM|nr:hypothetical protein DFH94DRAFT_738552 [Russula ochroleuca]
MAASTNVQLSLQIQRSLQTQPHPFDSALLQQTSPSPTTSDFSEVSVSLALSTPVESFGPPAPSLLPPPDVQSQFSGVSTSCSSRSPSQIVIAHPYARLYAKKNATGAKRRKIWNHALEKSVFSAHEIATMGAPHRRTIYIATLEAHIDCLHAQLLAIGLYPVPFERLEPFKGLNCKTAKSMVAGLQHDASHVKMKLLELERANHGLRNILKTRNGHYVGAQDDVREASLCMRHDSLDSMANS